MFPDKTEKSISPKTAVAKRRVPHWRWFVYGLILIGGAMRFWALGTKTLWTDEIHALYVSQSLETLTAYCENGHTPPLRYLMMWALQDLPATEFAVRIPAALFGTATLLLMLWLGEVLRDRRTGIVAAVLLLLSPWHLLHSQDARYYAVMLFLALAALGLAIRIVEDPAPLWRWIVLAIVCALNILISYTTIFAVAPVVVWLLWHTWRRWLGNERARLIAYLRGIGVAAVIGLICLSPWLVVLLGLYERITTGVPPSQAPDSAPKKVLAWETNYDLSYANAWLENLSQKQPYGKWLIFAAFLAGLFAMGRDNRSLGVLAALWFLLPWLIVWVTGIGYFLPPRYMIHFLGLYLLVAAAGAVGVWDWVRESLAVSKSPRTGQRRLVCRGAIGLVILAILAGYIRDDLHYYRTEKQDWEAALKWLNGSTIPMDGVMPGVFWTSDALKYYGDRIEIPLHIFPAAVQPETIRIVEEKMQELVGDGYRLWYVTWSPFLPPGVKEILEKRYERMKVFPGMLGDIFIYRSRPKGAVE